ncbi:hypothetical protein CBR_g26213 [Chara braunii]|uniref:Uncharacterized protein n=1 Tax=Chara braunii TaxID=69332 RepID=A0A388L789_CHABU|nr:hypothetical protein CBR_g26213 [Chara braunii]|eukprot:GBG78180.1 hypothetical protein CBR_g26213 [Chara braunii]
MKSEGDKVTTEKGKVDDRELRKFHLTSVYDEQGTDWVDADKKVSLDLALFKGYGLRAFGMKPFEAKGDGSEFRMVHPVDFLNKTNSYRKSVQYPKVDAGHQFTGPLVPYDTSVQGVAGVLKSCGEGAGSSDKAAKRKQLATTPPQLQRPAATTGTSRSRKTDLQAVDQWSEEQTETEEDVGFRGRDVGSLEDSRHWGAGGDSEGNVELEERPGGSGRCDNDCSDEEHNEREQSEMGASSGGPHNDMEQSERMQNEDEQDDGGDGDVETGGASKSRGKRKANASRTPAAMKKRVRKEVVDDARYALDASQETLGEAAKKHKEGIRFRKTSQPKRAARSSRLPKSDDSSDDAEGVGPRRPDLSVEDETKTKRPRAVDMAQCFFLEYDGDDRKIKDVPRVCIDVMSIFSIPKGDIVFNQRSLNKAIVAGLDALIDRSTAQRGVDDDASREPSELILAPITPCVNEPNVQGTRILSEDFDWRRAKEYFYYPVAEQHTAEVIKKVVRWGSPAFAIYGLHDYDRVRVVYFDDDHKHGYSVVSTYDNTRGDRAMLPSFHQACEDIRGFWRLKNYIEPVGFKVAENDINGKMHQETWQKFMRVCIIRCPRDMPGRQEGKLPGQYTEEVNGKKEGFHCIATKDGGHGATVIFKDLVPSNFKCFGDMTAREKEVALRLMINKKVIATARQVPTGKLNMNNLLDIIMRERYMMRLFDYIVFKSENKEKDDWNQEFFFDYKGMTERYGVTAEAWDEERDKIPLEYVRKVPKRLGGDQEMKGLKGAGLKATEALYKDAPFHFKVFVYPAIRKVDLLTAEMRRFSNAALHLLWEGNGRRATLLSINMHPKELLPAQDEVVTAATNLNCKATILDLALPSHCSAWSLEDFDALYKMMSKLCGENLTLIVFAPQKHHKTVMRHLYNWENVEVIPGTWKRFMGVGTPVNKYGNMQIESKDTMTIVLHAEGGDLRKVTRVSRSEADIVEVNVVEQFFKRCAAKHGGDEGNEKEEYERWEQEPQRLQTLCNSFLHEDEGVIVLGKPHKVGAFALFVARCDELKFMRHCSKLTYNDYSDVARRTDAWNPIDSDEETETSDLEIDLRVKRSRDGAHGREGVQNVLDGSVQNENPEGGVQQFGPLSTHVVDTQDMASSAGEFPRDSPTPIQAVINTLLHDNRYGYQGEKRSIRRMSGGMRMNDVREDADEDDLVVPGVFPKLTPGDDIPESFMQGSTSPYVFHDVREETSSEK